VQGQQYCQRVFFDTIDLEAMIPRDHLLRCIDQKIDFDFIYELTRPLYCAGNGRPSIDSALFFRMQLISYLYGMKSDRELCREVYLNLVYRWFCCLKSLIPYPTIPLLHVSAIALANLPLPRSLNGSSANGKSLDTFEVNALLRMRAW
jgi:transposase